MQKSMQNGRKIILKIKTTIGPQQDGFVDKGVC